MVARQFGAYRIWGPFGAQWEGLSDRSIRHGPRWTPLGDTLSGSRRFNVAEADAIVLGALGGGDPAWLSPVVSELVRLLQLPENWDSYGATKLDFDKIEFGLRLLFMTLDVDTPVPAVVPTSEGGVQFEWHTGGIDLEIDVLAVGKVGIFLEDQSGEPYETTLTSDFRPLGDIFEKLHG